MATEEEKSGWLSRWVGLLHEFASPLFQERVWVKASKPGYVSSHTELLCGYFDDLALSLDGGVGVGYRLAVQEGLVTQAEARGVDRFHHAACGYATEYERDAVYLTDPAWLAVASLAAEAWHGLKGVARPEVLALMREREAAHGEVPRGRDWDSREDWIDADLTVLTAAQGGRKYGIATGYRPNWDIGLRTPSGEVSYADAAVSIDGEPLGPEWGERRIEPGERGSVRLYPLAPEFWYRLLPGQEIRMCEGSRVVGHGVVREVGLAPLF